MPLYLERAEDLRGLVKDLMQAIPNRNESHFIPVTLGHIINLAVRCNPRQPQGTVRKNIVATAMKDYCNVRMTKETDKRTGVTYNKIYITAKERKND